MTANGALEELAGIVVSVIPHPFSPANIDRDISIAEWQEIVYRVLRLAERMEEQNASNGASGTAANAG